jgi:leader peptidase (prepilin peptidase) / N-methyltransferase
VIDIKLMIIPDVISLPMVLASPLVVYLHPDLTWQSSLLGVLLGAGLLYGIAWLYYLVRGEAGMGMGDVKLLGVVGGWLGYEAILPTIFLGSLLGSAIGILLVIGSKQRSLRSAVPFGPFLALGAVIYFFFGQKLQDLLIKTA